MTKDEIKKALECCTTYEYNVCEKCPYLGVGDCSDAMIEDALDLITEQEKEIEQLKTEIEELSKVVPSKIYDLIDKIEETANARKKWEEQVKIDVLNELKNHSYYDDYYMDGYVFFEDIDKMIEELKK